MRDARSLRRLSEGVIGAAIEVHRALGPGLLESAYEACLAHELTLRSIRFERQRILPIAYKGVELDAAYRIDFVVEGALLVELKAVSDILAIHEAQVLTYLELSGLDVGLLMNFHARLLRNGVRRFARKGAALPWLPTSDDEPDPPSL